MWGLVQGVAGLGARRLCARGPWGLGAWDAQRSGPSRGEKKMDFPFFLFIFFLFSFLFIYVVIYIYICPF
jgi:hypothetical protein